MFPPPTAKQLALIRGDQDHDQARYDPEGKRLCNAGKAGMGECHRDRDHSDGSWDAGVHVTYDSGHFQSWMVGEEETQRRALEMELTTALKTYARDAILDLALDVLDEISDRVNKAIEDRAGIDNQFRQAHYAGQAEGLGDAARAIKDALTRTGIEFPS